MLCTLSWELLRACSKFQIPHIVVRVENWCMQARRVNFTWRKWKNMAGARATPAPHDQGRRKSLIYKERARDTRGVAQIHPSSRALQYFYYEQWIRKSALCRFNFWDTRFASRLLQIDYVAAYYKTQNQKSAVSLQRHAWNQFKSALHIRRMLSAPILTSPTTKTHCNISFGAYAISLWQQSLLFNGLFPNAEI